MKNSGESDGTTEPDGEQSTAQIVNILDRSNQRRTCAGGEKQNDQNFGTDCQHRAERRKHRHPAKDQW